MFACRRPEEIDNPRRRPPRRSSGVQIVKDVNTGFESFDFSEGDFPIFGNRYFSLSGFCLDSKMCLYSCHVMRFPGAERCRACPVHTSRISALLCNAVPGLRSAALQLQRASHGDTGGDLGLPSYPAGSYIGSAISSAG